MLTFIRAALHRLQFWHSWSPFQSLTGAVVSHCLPALPPLCKNQHGTRSRGVLSLQTQRACQIHTKERRLKNSQRIIFSSQKTLGVECGHRKAASCLAARPRTPTAYHVVLFETFLNRLGICYLHWVSAQQSESPGSSETVLSRVSWKRLSLFQCLLVLRKGYSQYISERWLQGDFCVTEAQITLYINPIASPSTEQRLLCLWTPLPVPQFHGAATSWICPGSTQGQWGENRVCFLSEKHQGQICFQTMRLSPFSGGAARPEVLAHGYCLCTQAPGKVSALAEPQAARGNQRRNKSLLSLAHQDSSPSGTVHHRQCPASVLHLPLFLAVCVAGMAVIFLTPCKKKRYSHLLTRYIYGYLLQYHPYAGCTIC